MNGQVDVKTLTVEQLKSLAYDEIQKFEISRQNLQVINAEIARKQNTPIEPETKNPLPTEAVK